MCLLHHLILILLLTCAYAQKIYVVERERGSVAVIAGDRVVGEIRNLGNLNHATLKFMNDYAYVVSRDGFISRIDTERDQLIKSVKVGESTIGFTFCGDKVVVANYEPYTVVFLSAELEPLQDVTAPLPEKSSAAWVRCPLTPCSAGTGISWASSGRDRWASLT